MASPPIDLTIEEVGNDIIFSITENVVATDFLSLLDTPPSYAGQSLKGVRVKSTEDGLEFFEGEGLVDWGEIGGTLSNQTDLQNELDLKADTTYVDNADDALRDEILWELLDDIITNKNKKDVELVFSNDEWIKFKLDGGGFGSPSIYTYNPLAIYHSDQLSCTFSNSYLNMENHRIIKLTDGIASTDAVNKGQMDAGDYWILDGTLLKSKNDGYNGIKIPYIFGDDWTLTNTNGLSVNRLTLSNTSPGSSDSFQIQVNIDMDGHKVTDMADGTSTTDAINLGQLNSAISGIDLSGYVPYVGNLYTSGNTITNFVNTGIIGGTNSTITQANCLSVGGTGSNSLTATNGLNVGGGGNTLSGYYALSLNSSSVKINGPYTASIQCTGTEISLDSNLTAAVCCTGGEFNNADYSVALASLEPIMNNAVLGFMGATFSCSIEGEIDTILSSRRSKIKSDYSMLACCERVETSADKQIVMGSQFITLEPLFGLNSFGSFGEEYGINDDKLVGRITLEGESSDATPFELTIGNGNYFNIAQNHTYGFSGSVLAVCKDTPQVARYKFEGVIENVSGTVNLIWSSVTEQVDESGVMSLSLSADDTNDRLVMTATGIAANTVKWVGKIELERIKIGGGGSGSGSGS